MSKKTETIEVRVSPELKEQIHQVSKQRGQPMSEFVRQLLLGQISGSADEAAHKKPYFTFFAKSNRFVAFGLSALGLVALAFGWNSVTRQNVAAKVDVRHAFTEVDTDKDGFITEEEHAAFIQMPDMEMEDMPGMELDGGSDTKAEVPNSEFELAGACEDDFRLSMNDPLLNFGGADANHDGRIDYMELLDAFVKMHMAEFSRYDSDANGSLDRTEFGALPSKGGTELPAECADTFGNELADSQEDELPIGDSGKPSFKTLDKDRNGTITLSEYLNSQSPFGLELTASASSGGYGN